MRRLLIPILAAGLLVTPEVASAQASTLREPREPMPTRQDRAREDRVEGRRVSVNDVLRNVSAGRPGRRLDIQPQGSDYVVTWEYPDGRVRYIPVDGRTGRPRGE